MCVVSLIYDHYGDKWGKPPYKQNPFWPDKPWDFPINQPNDLDTYLPPAPILPQPKVPSQDEINEFYELLKKAREYDKKNKEPECESEEKKKKLQKLADEMGIKIEFPD